MLLNVSTCFPSAGCQKASSASHALRGVRHTLATLTLGSRRCLAVLVDWLDTPSLQGSFLPADLDLRILIHFPEFGAAVYILQG
jgi:hypothetical protein